MEVIGKQNSFVHSIHSLVIARVGFEHEEAVIGYINGNHNFVTNFLFFLHILLFNSFSRVEEKILAGSFRFFPTR